MKGESWLMVLRLRRPALKCSSPRGKYPSKTFWVSSSVPTQYHLKAAILENISPLPWRTWRCWEDRTKIILSFKNHEGEGLWSGLIKLNFRIRIKIRPSSISFWLYTVISLLPIRNTITYQKHPSRVEWDGQMGSEVGNIYKHFIGTKWA